MQAFADSELAHDLARDVEFERLYRRYVRDVYRYTLAVLRNPADAEDITQTTFLNAYRAFLRGEKPVKPRHWLIKIAHNACRSRHLRAVRRPQEVPLEETLAAVRISPDEAPKVEELLAALGRLPFNQRAAVVMRELEGRSYAEIADTLGVSVSAVETLIFRARRALKRDRSLLEVLSVVQLPPSLAGYVAGGSGAVAGGGAAVGSGLLVKAALLVAAGLLAGTVEKTVTAGASGGAVRPQVRALWKPAGLLGPQPAEGAQAQRAFVAGLNGQAWNVLGDAAGAPYWARLAGGPDPEAGGGSAPAGLIGPEQVVEQGSAGTVAGAGAAPISTQASSSSSSPTSSSLPSAPPLPTAGTTTDPTTSVTQTSVPTVSAPPPPALPVPTPSVPSAPSVPGVPSVPSVPGVPAVPTPSVPAVPTPTVPDVSPPPLP